MMNAGLISIRYAKALYEYALGRNEEQVFYQRMQTLSSMLRGIPKLRDTLSSPVVPVKYKKEILREAAGPEPEQSYLDFVRLILKNNRKGRALLFAASRSITFCPTSAIIVTT